MTRRTVEWMVVIAVTVLSYSGSVHGGRGYGWSFGSGGGYQHHNYRGYDYHQPTPNQERFGFNGFNQQAQDRVGQTATEVASEAVPLSISPTSPAEAAFNSILAEGPPVERNRRQNGSLDFSEAAAEGRQNNLNSCKVENNQVVGRWRCNNGQIIDCSGLCNGQKNCADGSDETVLSCRHVFCLDSAFRCSYGGCIRSELECNGVEDCADGSDEKTINCPGVLESLRANGNCSEGFFQCKSGECIYDDGLCTGGAECKDGSDETAALCSTHFCPEPGFRCDYGGCVAGMARCDGKRDCADGSDEKPEMCAKFNSANPPNRVPNIALPTTPTGSIDTSPLTTSSFDAAPLTSTGVEYSTIDSVVNEFRDLLFRQEMLISMLREENLRLRLQLLGRLGSGAGSQLALPPPRLPASPRPVDPVNNNNFNNLRDQFRRPGTTPLGSNNNQNANTRNEQNRRPEVYRPQISQPTTTPSVESPQPSIPQLTSSPFPPTNEPREEGDCDAPVLQGGRVSDVFSQLFDNGRFVKNGQEIIFQCLAGTSLIGVNSTYCINGNLLHDLPLCTNQCPGLPLNTLSVRGECFNPRSEKIPCSPLLPPGTIAVLSCKVGYRRPDRVVPDAYTCMEDGNWNAHVFKCIPICGEVNEGRQLIVGGEESNITQVPWHAGIYEDISGKMEQICGGSIINPTAIVSAAHCFWDQSRRQMKDAELYRVAVGKTLRDFDADEPTAQKYKVASIKIYEQYMDVEGLFISDIAVVLLDQPIIFQSYIKPICVEYSLKGNQRYVVSGITGRVAGWGLTASDGRPSPVLKTIDLPTIDFNTCLKESPPPFKPFITTDKFCGGFTTGASVCRGDSGGGLAFPQTSADKRTTTYFLRGIVSVGPILKGSCDNTKYSAFTDIQLHNLFLYEFLLY